MVGGAWRNSRPYRRPHGWVSQGRGEKVTDEERQARWALWHLRMGFCPEDCGEPVKGAELFSQILLATAPATGNRSLGYWVVAGVDGRDQVGPSGEDEMTGQVEGKDGEGRPSTLASGWGSQGGVHSRGATMWALRGLNLQGARGSGKWKGPECSPGRRLTAEVESAHWEARGVMCMRFPAARGRFWDAVWGGTERKPGRGPEGKALCLHFLF